MADILIIGAGGVGSVVAHKCAQLARSRPSVLRSSLIMVLS